MLPEEVLLEVFAFYVCGTIYDNNNWEPLVHICRRWRSIMFAAPRRLNLQLVCTHGVLVREMLDIWPPLPIYVWVEGPSNEINDNILAALEQHDHICEVNANNVSDDELQKLVGAMQVTFPALTDLYLHLLNGTVSLPKSFLGGSVPNLRSLGLVNIAFRSPDTAKTTFVFPGPCRFLPS